MPVFVGKNKGFKVNVEVKGIDRNDPFPTALRRMKELKDRKKELNRIFRRALEPMRLDMSQLAPVDTGALEESFRVRSLRSTSRSVFAWRVGAVSGEGVGVGGLSFDLAGWRDHWAELGTRHHAPTPHIAPAISKNVGQVRSNLDYAIFTFLDGLIHRGKRA